MNFLAFSISIILLFQIVYSEESKSTKKPINELRIGIKKRINDCTEKAKDGDMIHMHYTGTLYDDGSKFDSSLDRGDPLKFTLGTGQVIKGWDLGIQGMCVGEKRKLFIPSHLGYGDNGSPPKIPPKATLVFEVELMKIEKRSEL